MAAFWIDQIASGFSIPRSSLGTDVFTLLFGVSCAIKFTTETFRGYYQLFRPHTYLYFNHHAMQPRLAVTERVYKGLYLAKVFAALALVLGMTTKPALVVLALALWVEVRTYFKFHANLMFLVAVVLLLAPTPTFTLVAVAQTSLRHAVERSLENQHPLLAQLMLMVTLSTVYIATAKRKINAEFLSGIVVAGSLAHALRERPFRKHFDGVYPRWLQHHVLNMNPEQLGGGWRAAMVAVVLIELALPPLLAFPKTYGFGVLIGTLMHGAFTVLFPATLLHFSLLCVFSYVLFVDPVTLGVWMLEISQ